MRAYGARREYCSAHDLGDCWCDIASKRRERAAARREIERAASGVTDLFAGEREHTDECTNDSCICVLAVWRP